MRTFIWLLVIRLITAESVCNSDNCKQITFNGANDENAWSQVHDFIKGLAKDCRDVTISTTVKAPIATDSPNVQTTATTTTLSTGQSTSLITNHPDITTIGAAEDSTTMTPTSIPITDSTATTAAKETTTSSTITTVGKQETTTQTEETTTNPRPGWEKSGDKYYKCFLNEPINYDAAEAACASHQGRLAAEVLRDPATARYIATNCVGTDNLPSWVGFDDIAEEGTWVWVDGGSMNDVTTAWNTGEPNNATEGEDCGHITKVDDRKLLLNDNNCDENISYVCEV